jgi:type IV pilus assembly protein PilC
MAVTKERAQQLITFNYEGLDRRGSKIKGEIEAKNPALVKAELRRQGIQPTRVRRKPKPLFGGSGKRITARDIATFSRQLATMIKAGVPLVSAFEVIAGGVDNQRMKKLVTDIKSDVEGGSSLSESLAKHPKHFDTLYVNLVKAGEAAGVLDDILDTIATYKERVEALKGKIKKALYYPIVVIAVAVIVSAILLVFVVPQFEAIFQSYGADLPMFTQMVVSASESVRANGWFYLIIIIAAIIGFVMARKRSKSFARLLDRASLRIPVVGQILYQAAVARFSRTLAITFRAGVPLVEALETVAGATGNYVFEEAVMKIREDVATGHQLQLAMKQTKLFPHMVIQMTAIGEESGALDEMLTKIAEYYEEEVNNAVDALSSLLEPFVIILIGVLVGGMVVAMYLPIFKLAAVM